MSVRRFRIVVCRGPECGDKRNSAAVYEAFRDAINADAAGRCELDWQSCFGRCSQGPNVLVREAPPPTAAAPRFLLADLPVSRGGGPRLATALYNHVAPVNAVEVVASHVLRGAIVTRLVERLPVSGSALASLPVAIHTADSAAPLASSPDSSPPDTLVPEVLADVPTP